MPNWSKILASAEIAGRINRRLSQGLAQCPVLEEGGWTFQCVHFQVGTGTYPVGRQSEWHVHQEYQLEIGLGGCIQFQTRTQKMKLRNGEVVVIPWKYPHRWICEKAGPMVGVSLVLVPTVESIRSNGWLFTEARLHRSSTLQSSVDQLLAEAMKVDEPAFGGRRQAAQIF